jgi:hypothetical protein
VRAKRDVEDERDGRVESNGRNGEERLDCNEDA